MATDVIYADTTDGYIQSSSGTYSTARAGSGTLSASTSDSTNVWGFGGQVFGAGQYFVYQGFFQFDTTPIGTDTVSAATFSLYASLDQTSTDYTAECRVYDWGTSLTTADFIAGANLGSYTLVAHWDTSGGVVTNAYTDFTDDALAANINGSGQTRLFVSSSRHRNNNTPSGNETARTNMADNTGTTKDPKLTITHTAASNQTATPGVASLTLTGLAPTVTASDHRTATPGVASLTLSAFAPTATASNHQTATPATAALALTTFAPAVRTPVTVTPGVAALALTTFAPTVTAGSSVTVTPGTASLTITPFAPSALAPRTVTPDAATLSITGSLAFSSVSVAGHGPSPLIVTVIRAGGTVQAAASGGQGAGRGATGGSIRGAFRDGGDITDSRKG